MDVPILGLVAYELQWRLPRRISIWVSPFITPSEDDNLLIVVASASWLVGDRRVERRIKHPVSMAAFVADGARRTLDDCAESILSHFDFESDSSATGNHKT
jgi:hypothetical protein